MRQVVLSVKPDKTISHQSLARAGSMSRLRLMSLVQSLILILVLSREGVARYWFDEIGVLAEFDRNWKLEFKPISTFDLLFLIFNLHSSTTQENANPVRMVVFLLALSKFHNELSGCLYPQSNPGAQCGSNHRLEAQCECNYIQNAIIIIVSLRCPIMHLTRLFL